VYPPTFHARRLDVFDSLDDQMKAEGMEGSPKEKLVRYIVIFAVSVVVVAAIFAIVTFVK
jgi:hypothetical protein